MAAPSSSSWPEVEQLKSILLRTGKRDLTTEDIRSILSSLTNPGEPHSLALAVLSRFLNPSPSSSTRTALHAFLESLLAGTDSQDLVQGLSVLSAVLQVAPAAAASLLQGAALRSRLEEAVEHISRSVGGGGGKGKGWQDDETLALVEFLSLAAGQQGMRGLVRKTAGRWLESLLGEPSKVVEVGKGDEEPKKKRLKALVGVGVVKLRLGKDEPSTTGLPTPPDQEEPSRWSLEELAKLFVQLVTTSSKEEGVLLSSLEALAYLTLTSSTTIKAIVTDSAFLTVLFSFAPEKPAAPISSSSARDYAIATLLDHLTAFPPPPDADPDAAQIARLKKFAAAAAKKGEPAPTLDREPVESVTARISLIIKHTPSPIPTVRQLCLSPSLQTRRLAAKILQSLVTSQPLRGQLLQAGAARFFLSLIRQFPTPFSPSDDTPAVQGLAKLLITANPLLVLGPTASSPLLLEATTALTLPFGVPSSVSSEAVGLLPRFESLMALTNIASLDPSLTDQLARLTLRNRPGVSLLTAVEDLLLSSNTMVRRAAMELVCNLAASDPGVEHFEPPSSSLDTTKPPSPKLHLLLALSSSPDTPTRLASTGALASLAYSPRIALAFASFSRWVEILLTLCCEDEDPGVRHRVYEVWRVVGEVVVGQAEREGEGEREGREKARRGIREGKVVERLREQEGREKVLELREVVRAAREAVEKV
ncbi:hypothetical protein JCM8547_008579 [Rhodosporidiobolus lusitaniae]